MDVTNLDITRLANAEEFERRHGYAINLRSYFAAATIQALREHPTLNATAFGGDGESSAEQPTHFAVRWDAEQEVRSFTVPDAMNVSFSTIVRALSEGDSVADAAGDGGPSATFTLIDTSARGTLYDIPDIRAENGNALAFGAVVNPPVAMSDELGDVISIRRMTYVSLVADDRLVDGPEVAQLLLAVKTLLEDASWGRAVLQC